jgi:hypothetical protein
MLQPDAAGYRLSEQVELACSSRWPKSCNRALSGDGSNHRSAAMRQITLPLEPNEPDRLEPILALERERELVEAMAQASSASPRTSIKR